MMLRRYHDTEPEQGDPEQKQTPAKDAPPAKPARRTAPKGG